MEFKRDDLARYHQLPIIDVKVSSSLHSFIIQFRGGAEHVVPMDQVTTLIQEILVSPGSSPLRIDNLELLARANQMRGWSFARPDSHPWRPTGTPGCEMQRLGSDGIRMMVMLKLEPGYVGKPHRHDDSEFTHVLSGDVVSNGVAMTAGHSYVAMAGTMHTEFRSVGGATVLSVFKVPALASKE